MVSAAGIMVELGLAVLALIAWGQLEDGLLRDAAFAVMAIGGISTLLFNGNPLLRFDGYYVLSDLIEVPNLASRSARFYTYLVQRYLLGLKAVRPPVLVRGERRWLAFYGAASTLYRLAISIGIAIFLITVIPTLGWLLAAWLLFAQVALPVGKQLRFLLFDPALAGRHGRAVGLVGGLSTALLGVLAFLPIGSNTQVDGVVMLPERAIVRAEADGFLERQLVGHGVQVSEGEPLFTLRNAAIENEVVRQRARVAEFVARLDAVPVNDRVAREIQAERLADARADLARFEERLGGLDVLSPGAGILQFPNNADLQGRLVEQGTLLAYLADGSNAQIRIIANQEQAARIRAGFERVEVRVAGEAASHAGHLLDEVPAGSDVLPSAALGSRGGGAIQVDARDEQGRKALHRVFAFDVTIPQTETTRFIGSRAHVRFEHDASPLLARAYDTARRFLMARLGE
jgi:putative peptide zinc metalloprotease protein